MKRVKELTIIALLLLSTPLFTGCDVYSYVASPTQQGYQNPEWAPPYTAGARYYYLPDIETYYDLSDGDFIYLDNGLWVSSPNLPPMYADFDLNDCYVVVLDANVYQPWLHYQYYVSNYPRYYYRDYYDHSNIPYVRGFNENSRSAIYWPQNQRGRARSWDNENLNSNRGFKYSKQDRQQQTNWNNQTNNHHQNNGNTNRNTQINTVPNHPASNNNYNRNDQHNPVNDPNTTGRPANSTVTRPAQNDNNRVNTGTGHSNMNRQQPATPFVPQQQPSTPAVTHQQQPATTPQKPERAADTHYYGRTIGQPVKVQKQMRNQSSPAIENRSSNSNRERNNQNNQERR
jgi:hypothetical protein